MVEQVEHVDALFGGKSVRFELWRSPQPMASVENIVGSAYEVLQRFFHGTWTATDLHRVLAAAYTPNHGRLRQFGGLGLGGVDFMLMMIKPDDVGLVLASGPHAKYAPLASKVLEAYLFGLPKADATFDENEGQAAGEVASAPAKTLKRTKRRKAEHADG